MDLYVYYRVQHQHSAELQAIVMNMQEKLGNLHGMNFSLKRRVEKNVDYQTWMEIYFSVSDEFTDELVSVTTKFLWICHHVPDRFRMEIAAFLPTDHGSESG